MFNIDNFIFDPCRLILFSKDIDKSVIETYIPNDDDFFDSKWRLDKLPLSSNINQKLRLPTEGGICLTYKCQLHCNYCSFKSTEHSVFQIQQKDINGFINYLIKNIVISNFYSDEKKKLEISFSGGGEPTFDWTIFKQTVEYIKAKCNEHNIEYELNMTTNGVMSSEQAEYITNNFHGVMVSFDGLPSLQNQNRNNKNFLSADTVIKTIHIFDKSDLVYTIRSSVWQKDFHLLKDIAKFLYEEFNRFDGWSIMPVIPVGRALEEHRVKNMFTYKENFIEYYFQVYEYIKNEFKKENIRTPLIMNDLVGIFCGAVYGEALWLFPDNRIIECLDAIDVSPVLGKIENGIIQLKDIYYDNLFDKYREKFYECSECLAYRFCKGGCPIKFLRNGTSSHAAWECSMTVEYWKTLFKKIWDGESCFGWRLERISIPKHPNMDIYKLKNVIRARVK